MKAEEHAKLRIQTHLGEARDELASLFGDEIYAQRLQATRNAIDVALAGVDALFIDGSAALAQETTRLIGVKAAAETNGEVVDDENVVTPVGDKAGAVQLPDIDESRILEHDKEYIPPGTVAYEQARKADPGSLPKLPTPEAEKL